MTYEYLLDGRLIDAQTLRHLVVTLDENDKIRADLEDQRDRAWADRDRLAQRVSELEAENERLALAHIGATNPGIDMDEVKRTRSALHPATGGEGEGGGTDCERPDCLHPVEAHPNTPTGGGDYECACTVPGCPCDDYDGPGVAAPDAQGGR